MWVALQARLEPQRPFEIQVVRGLVEEEHVGFGEERGGKRHAHAPASGEFRHRPGKVGHREAEAGQDLAGAGRSPVSIDLDQARVDLAHALGRGGLEFPVQGLALEVGRQDRVDETDRSRRVLLIDGAHLGRLRQVNETGIRLERAEDDLEEGGFADAVAADEPDLRSRRNRHAGLREEAPPPGIEGEIFDLEHAGDRLKREAAPLRITDGAEIYRSAAINARFRAASLARIP
ncbi:hypothetical protein AEGHOMDF_5329 [Methylobacterium soli]|nr:hypothetical protein AEGHOMDF_5329 [Methylobacterium soli]